MTQFSNSFRRYYRTVPVGSIGLKPTGKRCEGTKSGRPCRGMLHDVCLDWEDPLPEEDLRAADKFSRFFLSLLSIFKLSFL